jgi:hypothetical protein
MRIALEVGIVILTRHVSKIGMARRISNDINIAITPNNLLGIDRKIA